MTSHRAIVHQLNARWMRGGTSKGLFFQTKDVDPKWPRRSKTRDLMLCRAMGSPDVFGRQMDGLGGATSSTSKIALIGKPSQDMDGIDVTYEFGQVPVKSSSIDWTGSCGNLAAAVGVFAIEEGLVQVPMGASSIEIVVWQVNRSQRIRLTVQVDPNTGSPLVQGDEWVAGIPFPGAPCTVTFERPGFGHESYCLPTGNAMDVLPRNNNIQASIVDAGNPTVFVRATDLGLSATELELSDRAVLKKIESIRCEAAVLAGLDQGQGLEYVQDHMPAVPKVSWVAPPTDYFTSSNLSIASKNIDLVARIVSVGKLHHAFTGTGAISLAAAAAIPGTIVHETIQRKDNFRTRTSIESHDADIRIGHTAGVLRTQSLAEQLPQKGGWMVKSGGFVRTARTIMAGTIYFPG